MLAECETELRGIQARLATLRTAPATLDLEARRMEKEACLAPPQPPRFFKCNAPEGRRALEMLLDGALAN